MTTRRHLHTPGSVPGARGFTLTELLMVVVVLAVLAVLAAPSFVQMLANSRLRGQAAEAYSDLQFARSASVERNVAVTMTFSGTGWQITRPGPSGAVVMKSVTLSDGVSITSGAGMTVVFNPVRAMAAVSNGPAVLERSGASGTVRVDVNAMGRAEICTSSGTLSGYPSC